MCGMKKSHPEIPADLFDTAALQALAQAAGAIALAEVARQGLDVTGYVGDQLVTVKAEQLLKGATAKKHNTKAA